MNDYSAIQNAIQTLIYIVGGAIAIVGVIDALSGYSNQSSGKMSEGIIKAVGGAGIVAIGATLVPELFKGLGGAGIVFIRSIAPQIMTTLRQW